METKQEEYMERPPLPDYENENKMYTTFEVLMLNFYINHLERKLKIIELKAIEPDKAFCSCIDKCSWKDDEYYCGRESECTLKR